jgi:hypothetical protein
VPKRIRFFVLLALHGSATVVPAEPPPAPRDPRAIIEAAKRVDRSYDGQALALAQLAWPRGGVQDLAVSLLAREELVGFGKRAYIALRAAIQTADPLYHADIASAMVEAMRHSSGAMPAEYLSTLDDAIWFGTTDAQRIAMSQVARFQYRGVVLSIIDAASLDPALAKPGILALGQIGDDRARFFLGEYVSGADPELRRLAAEALARIGARALDVLREHTRSDSAAVREAAVHALVPITGLDDLTVLHEYVGLHADDDPEVVARARERAALLEKLLEQQQSTESAPQSSEF